MDYEHPLYTAESVAAQRAAGRPRHGDDGLRRRLPRLGLPRGRLPLRRRGGRHFGVDLVSGAAAVPAVRPTGTQALPALPALVLGDVRHQRPGPVRHAFSHRVYQWLVDLDDLPDAALVPAAVRRVPGRGPPRATPARTIKANVERFLGLRGIRLGARRPGAHAGQRPGPRPRLRPADASSGASAPTATSPASSPRCTTPTASGTPTCCAPTPSGRASADKEFYVSPFNDVAGRYEIRFVLRPDRVGASITARARRERGLHRLLQRATRWPQPAARSPGRSCPHPLMPQRVSALIRLHGIWLWLRRLPLARRPHHRTQEGV